MGLFSNLTYSFQVLPFDALPENIRNQGFSDFFNKD